MSFDVFISYSTKDMVTAKAACAALEAMKIRCWMAPRDILPGARWGASIVRAISQCRVMVLIFSGNANSSSQVQREVDQAFGNGKPVVPLRIEDVKPVDDLAYYLNTVHWLDAMTPPLERNLERLVVTVEALLPTTVQHPRSSGLSVDEDAARAQDEARAEDERRIREGEPQQRAVDEGPPAKQAAAAQSGAESEQGGRDVEMEAQLREAEARQRAEAVARSWREAEQARADEQQRKRGERAASAEDSAQERSVREAEAPDDEPAAEARNRQVDRQKGRPSRRAVLIGGGLVGAGAAVTCASIVMKGGPSQSGSVSQTGTRPPDQSVRSQSIRAINVDERIYSIAVAPDGVNCLLGCGDTLRLLDFSSGQSRIFEKGDSWVLSVFVAPDGRKAVSAGYDQKVRIWDLPSGTRSQVLEGHTDVVQAVTVAPNGRTILSVDRDGHVRVWDLLTGKFIRGFDGRWAIAIAPDSRTFLTNYGGGLTSFDLQTGQLIRTIPAPFANQIAFLSNGSNVVTAEDNGLSLWDLKSGKAIRTFNGHTDHIYAVAVAPNGRQMLSGSYDKTLKLWDLSSGNAIRTFVGHTDQVFTVAITPDGRTGLSGGGDHNLRFWNLA